MFGSNGPTAVVTGGTFGEFCQVIRGAEIENATFGSMFVSAPRFHSPVRLLSGQVTNFLRARSDLELLGGHVGSLEVESNTTSLSACAIDGDATVSSSAHRGLGELLIESGVIGGNAISLDDGYIRMTGGTVESSLVSEPGLFEMKGGCVGGVLVKDEGYGKLIGGKVTGTTHVEGLGCLVAQGSEIVGNIVVDQAGQFRLVGSEFRILDINTGDLIEDLTPELNSLPPGGTIEIQHRDVTLEGILLDGAAIQYDLYSQRVADRDFCATKSVLKLAKGPRPRVVILPKSVNTVSRAND